MRSVLIVLLLASAAAHATPIRWVPPTPENARAIERGIARAADAKTAARSVAELLAAAQYYWPEIASERETLVVRSGPRAVPGGVAIIAADSVDAEVPANLFREALAGRSSTAAIATALRAVVEHYVQLGHPFAQARLAGIEIRRSPDVSFTVSVLPGPAVHAGRLAITGARSQDDVFVRQSTWRKGVPLTSALIERTQMLLAALPSMSSIDTAVLVPSAVDTSDLRFAVREAPAIRVSGLLGWIPRSSSRDGYWVGEAALRLLSPFGGGRSIHFFASRRDRESRHTMAELREPWPLGLPLWAGLSLGQRDFDTSFIETTAGLKIELPGTRPRWQIAGHWAKITPEESPTDFIFPSRRYGIGLALSDSAATGNYRLSVDWTAHRLFRRDGLAPPQLRLSHSQGRFAARRLVTVSRTVAIHLLGDAGGTLIQSEFIPPDLRFRVGGVHSLRGYNEEQFLADNYLRLGTELHFGTDRQSVFVFGEAGWLSLPQDPERVLTSAGFGLNIAQRLLLMFAVPGRGGLDQAKVHIALTSNR